MSLRSHLPRPRRGLAPSHPRLSASRILRMRSRRRRGHGKSALEPRRAAALRNSGRHVVFSLTRLCCCNCCCRRSKVGLLPSAASATWVVMGWKERGGRPLPHRRQYTALQAYPGNASPILHPRGGCGEDVRPDGGRVRWGEESGVRCWCCFARRPFSAGRVFQSRGAEDFAMGER